MTTFFGVLVIAVIGALLLAASVWAAVHFTAKSDEAARLEDEARMDAEFHEDAPDKQDVKRKTVFERRLQRHLQMKRERAEQEESAPPETNEEKNAVLCRISEVNVATPSEIVTFTPKKPETPKKKLGRPCKTYEHVRIPRAGKNPSSFTLHEVARILKVTVWTVYNLHRRGLLTFVKIGRATRIRREDLDTFVSAMRKTGGK